MSFICKVKWQSSSYRLAKLNPIGAFPLRFVYFPFINMCKGRVHNVTHYYNLEEKCVLSY